MRLLTKEVEAKLPKLYATEAQGETEKTAVVKFFDPTGGATWYAFEGERQPDGDFLFFGYVAGLVPGGDELGYFTLRELETAKKGIPGIRGLLPIERDIYFTPMTFAEIKAKHG